MRRPNDNRQIIQHLPGSFEGGEWESASAFKRVDDLQGLILQFSRNNGMHGIDTIDEKQVNVENRKAGSGEVLFQQFKAGIFFLRFKSQSASALHNVV